MTKKTEPKRPPGRPRFGESVMIRKNVMLDPDTIEKAMRIGGGELSRGLRLAVLRVKDK